MKTTLTLKDVTPAIKSAVNALLLATVYADTMREAVDEIERAVLAECPLTNGRGAELGDNSDPITDPNRVYLCSDEAQFADYCAECDKRERAAGLKPADMTLEYCPALVAGHLKIQAEWVLLEAAEEMLGLEHDTLNNNLLCAGLGKRKQMLDLLIGLVVNLPDYKAPVLARA